LPRQKSPREPYNESSKHHSEKHERHTSERRSSRNRSESDSLSQPRYQSSRKEPGKREEFNEPRRERVRNNNENKSESRQNFSRRDDDRRSGRFRDDRGKGTRYDREQLGEKNQRADSEKQYLPARRENPNQLIRLNRYIANAGVCSRREADQLILNEEIKVNGKVVTELGFKVKKSDEVIYKGKRLNPEKKVYLLLNKPKDTLTTLHDPEGRNTIYSYIKGATPERIYPVGRLDRNTTGLLLLTNDGELSDLLAHPSSMVEKLYHVVLDRNFEFSDFEKLSQGVELEDGFIAPDRLSYADGKKNELGVEIHSGRNRIVRRMFEHLGYKVVRLDRVLYAGLTKKGLARGAWRFLTPAEVRMLYSKVRAAKRNDKTGPKK